jgi:hypothetical protein
MMPTRAASVERPAFQISATSSSMSGCFALEMAKLHTRHARRRRVSSQGPDRRNFDSALLSFVAARFSPGPRMTLGKENPLVDSLTGGFSCGFQRRGHGPGGGTGGCRAGRSTRSRPNLNNQRFLRSFLRHFQQPRGAVARRAPSPICKVDSTPPFGPGFDGDMPYPPEKDHPWRDASLWRSRASDLLFGSSL